MRGRATPPRRSRATPAAGSRLGGLLAVYFRTVQRGGALFIVTVCFVIGEVGRRVGLDPLIACLAAGTFVRNVTKSGPILHARIESSALAVYVIFFAVAGAGTHLEVLRTVGGPVVLLVSIRAAALLAGARLGAKLGAAPPLVQRYVGVGLLPQAGLALALASIFVEAFPEFGAEARALTVGIVSLNELVAPAPYRAVLVHSGEARAAKNDQTNEQAVER